MFKIEDDDSILNLKFYYKFSIAIPFLIVFLLVGISTYYTLISDINIALKMLSIFFSVIGAAIIAFIIHCMQAFMRILIYHIERLNCEVKSMNEKLDSIQKCAQAPENVTNSCKDDEVHKLLEEIENIAKAK